MEKAKIIANLSIVCPPVLVQWSDFLDARLSLTPPHLTSPKCQLCGTGEPLHCNRIVWNKTPKPKMWAEHSPVILFELNILFSQMHLHLQLHLQLGLPKLFQLNREQPQHGFVRSSSSEFWTIMDYSHWPGLKRLRTREGSPFGIILGRLCVRQTSAGRRRLVATVAITPDLSSPEQNRVASAD